MRSTSLVALLLLLLPGCAERSEHASPALPPNESVAAVLVLLTKDTVSQSPVLGYDGSVYFSHGKNIRVVTPNGRHRLWTFEPGPRGHRILPDGTHIVCDSGRGAVLRLDSLARRLSVVARESEGQQLQTPAELVLDQWNGFFFTDAGDRQSPSGALHYATPGHVIRRLVWDLALPTGLALSADWSTLYLIENARNRILRFPVTQQGTLGPMSVFVELPGSDGSAGLEAAGGLCFDSSGNLYVAYPKMKEVLVLDSGGRSVRRYPVGNPTTGVCFGGPYLDQLFVTVSEPGALMRLNLGVKGLDLRPRR